MQVEKLQIESSELRRDAERNEELSRELALKAEMSRLLAEEEAKQHSLRLMEQNEELKKKHELEV